MTISWDWTFEVVVREVTSMDLRRLGWDLAYTIDKSRSVWASKPGEDAASFSASSRARLRITASAFAAGLPFEARWFSHIRASRAT